MKERNAGTPWPNKTNQFTQYGLESFPLAESASGEKVIRRSPQIAAALGIVFQS
jgi:hypothetical protein|tara:strand:- start:244 stop:405 length:162 start_codon:yes stop_codon:yes gene_type:complete